MAEYEQLEFLLIRYTGDVTKGESINLAVVAFASESDHGDFADIRFTRNWRRVLCFDPLAEIEELEAFERELARALHDPQRWPEFSKRANDSWSNSIQITPLQGCLTGLSPVMELERLKAMYLETRSVAEPRTLTGRQRILSAMRDELEKVSVLGLMQRNVPVADYTGTGDPLRFDFGYTLATDFKFLHAVSLSQGTDRARMLAFEFPKIAAGVQAKRALKTWLTAVVDDDLDRERDEVNFALGKMQESGIVIVPTAEMPQVAEGIRAELLG